MNKTKQSKAKKQHNNNEKKHDVSAMGLQIARDKEKVIQDIIVV